MSTRKKSFTFTFILIALFTTITQAQAANLRDLFWKRSWLEMEQKYNSLKKKTLTDHSLMANAYRFQEKWPEAVRILEANSRSFPASMRPYAEMTMLLGYEKMKQTNKALTLSESLYKTAPADLKYYVALAQYRLYDSQKDSKNALNALNRMLSNADTDERKIYTLTRLIKLPNNNKLVENALSLLELDVGSKEAAAVLARVKNPGNNVRVALGVYYHTIGDNRKSLDALKNATGRKAQYYRAWDNSRLKQNDTALNLWGSLAISGNSYSVSSVARIGNLAKDKGMFDKCVKVLERIVRERRGNVQARALQALINLEGKTPTKRKETFEAQFLKSFPNANYSFNILWARAWRNIDAKNYAEAVRLFRQADAPGVTYYKRARILYWLAYAQDLAGQKTEAQKTKDLIIRKYPLTVYGLILNPKPKLVNGSNPNLTLKPLELETWGFINHAYLKLSRPKASARELYRALTLSRWLGLEESYSEAKRLETLMTSNATLYRSDLEALYPRPYRAAVEAASKTYGVESSFVWAIMRQESAFKVNARSYVGAAGLMQLMPATAKEEAKRAGLSKYDLYNANDNIRLGTSHLSWLSRNFSKKEYVMAAYNAGSGNARKWLNEVGEKADLAHWIEAVRFDETNGYVQRVSANLEIYRMLYE